LRSQGIEAIAGNAAEDRVLKAANLAQARVLLVAIPEAFEAGQIVQQGRAANTALEIVARAHFDAEVEHLLQHGATKVIMGEREIARTMLDYAKALPRVSAAGGSG
jgi:CPA2 family monovalent cation:H+ antiporter-2